MGRKKKSVLEAEAKAAEQAKKQAAAEAVAPSMSSQEKVAVRKIDVIVKETELFINWLGRYPENKQGNVQIAVNKKEVEKAKKLLVEFADTLKSAIVS